jgi:hypothetical protein
LAEKAAEFVDTKSKTDFFTKLLRMFTIDPERENSESNPAQRVFFMICQKQFFPCLELKPAQIH